MVVGAGVGAAYDHNGHGVRVHAVVVDRGLEEVRVLGEPFGEVERWEESGLSRGAVEVGGQGSWCETGERPRDDRGAGNGSRIWRS